MDWNREYERLIHLLVSLKSIFYIFCRILAFVFVLSFYQLFSESPKDSGKNYSVFGGVYVTQTNWDIGALKSINGNMDKLTVFNLIGDFQRAQGTNTKIITSVETRRTNMSLIGGNGIIKFGERLSISYYGTYGRSGFDTFGFQAGNITGKFPDHPSEFTTSQNYYSPFNFDTSIRRIDHGFTINRRVLELNCNNYLFLFGTLKYQEFDYHATPRLNIGFEDNTLLETGSYLNNNRISSAEFRLKNKLFGPGLGLGYTYLINSINSINLSIGLIQMSGSIDQLINLFTTSNLKFKEFENSNITNTRFKLIENILASGYTLDSNYNYVWNDVLFRIHLLYQVTSYSSSNTNQYVYSAGFSTFPNATVAYGVPISDLENLLRLPNTGFDKTVDVFSGISFSAAKKLY